MENLVNEKMPENHIVKSILTLLFCCLPFGIVALVKASKVEGLWYSGQKDAALQAAEDANKWSNIAIICGVVWVALYLLFLLVTFLIGLFSTSY